MGKKIFIPSIDRVCGTDAHGKKLDFLHGSVRRYKTFRSSTNCGCGHLRNCNSATVHSPFTWPSGGALRIVVPAPGAAVAPLQAVWTSG